MRKATAMKMQTRVVSVEDSGSAPAGDDFEDESGGASPCPRCSNDIPVRLEKEDPLANTCYRSINYSIRGRRLIIGV